MKLQAVLFDLDGTLVDSAADLGAAVDQMRTCRGLPSLPFESYRQVAGAGARGLLGVAFGMTPDDADYAAYSREFLNNYEQRLTAETRVFAGVAALLQKLEQCQLPWGIVTNKIARFAEPITRQLPELQSAGVVISGDTTPHAKPHPAPLLEAASRLQVDPAQCLYVGDDQRDMQAARAAGMQGMAVLWGYLGNAPVSTWGADTQARQPQEAWMWIAQRLAA